MLWKEQEHGVFLMRLRARAKGVFILYYINLFIWDRSRMKNYQ